VTGFEGYRCWTTQDAAALPTEAVVASRALFFATHAPLKIFRSDPNGKRGDVSGASVNEEAVWNDFLGRKAPGGVLLMPIIGESGTGKSHLVRWVREMTPPTDERVVIYLPKNKTSLKGVLQELLAEVQNAELDQLRADVAKMSSQLNQAALEQRLINQFQEALAAAPPETGPAHVLSGKAGLQVLLQDPHVRDHLLRPGALIPQMAKSILIDRGKDEKDRPLEFTADDLPTDLLDPKAAARVTWKMLQLLGARPDLQDAAVRMLNEQVQSAVAEATSIGTGRLQQAMLEVRREFARQGKAIVLLIEDFAVIQGFQRDLLDALIEVGEREGRTELAPIRTLMAVTSGYFASLPDTVLTRVSAATGYVYSLDAQFDPEVRMGEISSFVGRYLNAARLGVDAVERYGARESLQVPNACCTCAFQEQCHDAFGKSEEGHGLYPFNESALRRTIRARPAPGDVGAFNPRVVVGEVVKNVLVEHAAAIEDGKFPDTRFAEEYRARRPGEPGYSADTREIRLSAATRSVLNELDPDDSDRHAAFLEFWGDAPETVVNLSKGMHEAFEIRLLNVTEVKQSLRIGTSVAQTVITSAEVPTGDIPTSVRQAIEHVEAWAAGESTLNQGTASNIREIIRDAVVERCAWTNPLMPEPTADVLRKAWPVGSAVVSIEGAYGQREATGAAPIKFTPSPENAVFFQGLLMRTKAGQVQAGAKSWRRLAGYADRYQGRLQQHVLRREFLSDEVLAVGIQASLTGATLAGKALPGMSDTELLTVLFDDGMTWDRGDAATCARSWHVALQKHREARPELVNGLRSGFGVSRGVRGGVRMIDAARAVPMLREAVRSWRWITPSTELAPWIKKAVSGFAEWDSLLDTQITALTGQLAGVRQFLPRGTSLTETIEAVSVAAQEAREAGADQAGPENYKQLQDLITQVKQRDWRAPDRLESELTAACDADQGDRARVTTAARDRGGDLEVIRQFLIVSSDWLTSALKAARMRQSGAQRAAEAQVLELLNYWAAIGGDN
jgi:AAA domain